MKWSKIVEPVTYRGVEYLIRVTWPFNPPNHYGTDISLLHRYLKMPTNGVIKTRAELNNGKVPSGLVIETEDYLMYFWHLSPEAKLNSGDTVHPGDSLGTFTESDRGHAPHLHIGFRDKATDRYVDPYPILLRNCYDIEG